MPNKVILLVEDNPNDEALMLRALKKNNILNKVVIACDDEAALEYLFGTGKYEGRDVSIQPQVTFLDLQLSKINEIEVLKYLRIDQRTMLPLVVILTIFSEKTAVIASNENGASRYIHKPVDFNPFIEAVKQLGLYWLVSNGAPVKRKENRG